MGNRINLEEAVMRIQPKEKPKNPFMKSNGDVIGMGYTIVMAIVFLLNGLCSKMADVLDVWETKIIQKGIDRTKV